MTFSGKNTYQLIGCTFYNHIILTIKHIYIQHRRKLLQGWEFIRYKKNQGNVIGASLSVDRSNAITIRDFGFSLSDMPYDF